MSKTKALFFFPPLWSYYSLSAGIPQIMGFLEKCGYDVTAVDLNIKFLYFLINNSKYLEELLDLYFLYTKNDNSLALSYKELLLKDNCKNLKFSVHVMRDVKCFCNKKLQLRAEKFIGILGKILESVLVEEKFWDYIKTKQDNVMTKFFEKIVNNISYNDYNFIGFSVNSKVQYFCSINFASQLKKLGYKNCLALGGTFVSVIKNDNDNLTAILDNCFNVLISGAGESPIKKILECIEFNKDFADVPNIIYKDSNGCIVHSNIEENGDIIEYMPTFSGYHFKEYLIPEPVVPLRVSFGCYYHKCTFCDYPLYGKFKAKMPEEILEEIIELKKRWGISNYYFVDAALSPAFLDKFSKLIIDKNIDIYYFSNFRFEKQYTKSFLARLYKSGLRACAWGLESASPKVLKDMNKGYIIEDAQNILINAYNVGLFCHLYIIAGFPTETLEDFNMTCDFVLNNQKYILSIGIHNFVLINGTYVFKHPEKFNLPVKKIKEILKRENNPYYIFPDSSFYDNAKEFKEKFKKVEEMQKLNKNIGGFDTFLLESKYSNKNN